jgi:DNA-directed RNA polymerase subunit RPC12/RpoP/uncharacterized protein YdcH (DUF465 family)
MGAKTLLSTIRLINDTEVTLAKAELTSVITSLQKHIRELTDDNDRLREEIKQKEDGSGNNVIDGLKKQNDELLDKIKSLEDWSLRSSCYQLRYPFDGVAVMERVSENHGPIEYDCPSCFENQKIAPLSLKAQRGDSHLACPSCSFRVDVGYIPAKEVLKTMKNV